MRFSPTGLLPSSDMPGLRPEVLSLPYLRAHRHSVCLLHLRLGKGPIPELVVVVVVRLAKRRAVSDEVLAGTWVITGGGNGRRAGRGRRGEGGGGGGCMRNTVTTAAAEMTPHPRSWLIMIYICPLWLSPIHNVHACMPLLCEAWRGGVGPKVVFCAASPAWLTGSLPFSLMFPPCRFIQASEPSRARQI